MDKLTVKVIVPLLESEIKKIKTKDSSDTDERFKKALKNVDKENLSKFKEIYDATDGSVVDKINAVNAAILDVFQSNVMLEQYNRIASSAVNMASEDSLEQFKKNVGDTFGIDTSEKYNDKDKFAVIRPKMDKLGFQHGITTESLSLDEIIKNNVRLIKKIPVEYHKYLEGHVRTAFSDGSVVSSTSQGEDVLSNKIQNLIKSPSIKPESRDWIAQRIARDQMGKIYADIGRAQQQQAGITLFKWQTSEDSRVSGNPNGLYSDAKISCYKIAKKMTEYGEGIYKIDEGAKWAGQSGLIPGKAHIQCRCQMIPLIEGVNYDPKSKKHKPNGV